MATSAKIAGWILAALAAVAGAGAMAQVTNQGTIRAGGFTVPSSDKIMELLRATGAPCGSIRQLTVSGGRARVRCGDGDAWFVIEQRGDDYTVTRE